MIFCSLLSACTKSVKVQKLAEPIAAPILASTATDTPAPTSTPPPPPTNTPAPAARIESGERALLNGDYEGALEAFDMARSATEDEDLRQEARLGIGRSYLLMGNTYEATRVLKNFIEDYPTSERLPQAHFFLAQAYNASLHYAEAADEYLLYLTLRPGVIDAYILDLRADALFAAGSYAEAARDYAAALQSPSLKDGILLEMKIARSLALSGDADGALALYDSIYARSGDHSTRALINLRKGQIYTNRGEMDQAYAAYLDSVMNYPSAYESYSALVELVNAGVPVNEVNRGLVDYYAGEYGLALAAFDRYLQTAPADPATAYYFLGLSQRAVGHYQAAVAAWDALITGYPEHPYWDEAWEEKAYTQWAYLDEYTLATETLLDFVKQAPAHPRAAEYLFDAAQVAERSGKLDVAAHTWERVADEYPLSDQAARALFLAGISYYRLPDYSKAYLAFQRDLSATKDLGERSAAYLWSGKTLLAMGDHERARSDWQMAAATDPTGYYSERAADLLSGRQAFQPPVAWDMTGDLQAERQKADDWMRQTFTLAADTDLSGLGTLADDPALNRGAALWELGLRAEARQEFEGLRQQMSADPVQTYRLANYFNELGVHRSATMAARQVLDLAGMDDASTMNAPRYFNRLRFGTHFADLVIPDAQQAGFNPLFVFSVIRQESLFESFVRSSAAASGLMQVIPATGAEMAQNLGWPENFTNSDLYRPIVSVRFGTEYLSRQVNAFDGDLYAALAAYNGGPGNSMEWKKLAPNDPDLFLEVIRYSETRLYIRRIYEIFSIYRKIYDRTP